MSYRRLEAQFMLFTCFGLFTSIASIFEAGRTDDHSYAVRDDLVANNKTGERLHVIIQNSTGACQLEIVQPRFDLHFGYKIVTLRITIFQPPLDDTLIILIDNVTIDVTRYENKSCYNINGKCHKGVCSCNITNNTFTSMYRTNIGLHKNGSAVGIEYRFYGIDGSIFKVISVRTFERAYFNHLYTHYSTIKCLKEDNPGEKFAYFASISYSIIVVCLVWAFLFFLCCTVTYKESRPLWISLYKLLQMSIILTNQHTKKEVNYRKKGYSSSSLISSKQHKCGTDKGSVLKADKDIGENICHVLHFESPIRNNLIINESCYKKDVMQDGSNHIWSHKKVLQPRDLPISLCTKTPLIESEDNGSTITNQLQLH